MLPIEVVMNLSINVSTVLESQTFDITELIVTIVAGKLTTSSTKHRSDELRLSPKFSIKDD